MRSTIRNVFPCSRVSRDQPTDNREWDQSKSRNKIFEKSHPESNQVGSRRQRSEGNIDELAMLAHTLHNVHEHHQN